MSEIQTIGCISIWKGRSISADNLLVRVRDLLPKCFAPTNIFAKMRCTHRNSLRLETTPIQKKPTYVG